MEERPFSDSKAKPEIGALKKALSTGYSYYEELLSLAADFGNEWNYSKTGGWMLRVSDKKKALFYLIPLHNSFTVSLTLREAEREKMMKDKELLFLRNQLLAAKKYSEGYGIRMLVTDRKSHSDCMMFIGELIALRC